MSPHHYMLSYIIAVRILHFGIHLSESCYLVPPIPPLAASSAHHGFDTPAVRSQYAVVQLMASWGRVSQGNKAFPGVRFQGHANKVQRVSLLLSCTRQK